MGIKVSKAIEILEDYKMESSFAATFDFVDALRLGVEALKTIQKWRDTFDDDVFFILQGEDPAPE